MFEKVRNHFMDYKDLEGHCKEYRFCLTGQRFQFSGSFSSLPLSYSSNMVSALGTLAVTACVGGFTCY